MTSALSRTAVVVALALASPANGLSANTGAGSDAWRVLAFPGIAPSRFVVDDDGRIEVLAENSSGLLYRMILPTERHRPFLTWRWRVDEATAPSDLTRKGADDRPLAVHLWFPMPPERRSLWQRLGDTVKTEILDIPLTGRVLTYVWGGTRARGDKMANPYLEGRGVMIVLRDGHAPTGQWFMERIDYARDFEMAFGTPPPSPSFIAVSGDADDTWGRSAGTVANLAFVARSPANETAP